MNAPFRSPIEGAREFLHGTAAERAHRHSISIHCPNQDEMTMAARVELAMLRDRAGAAMRRAGPTAAAILHEVSQLATSAVYAEAPFRKLNALNTALKLTVQAAWEIERATRD
ncbi:MAG: hypothetical protein PGN16_04310 [Sphingomonas phyllosphaerae]|uniref:hypothetical protein n=1 Tax=Sphingomonas phyllosphaerae TaxID=257003 RepID=UPI002FF57DD4